MTKYILSFIGILVVAGAIYGAYQYPKNIQLAGSVVGTVFNSAKVAQININPQSITSTSTSIQNTDTSDRIVTDGFVSCSGLTNMFGSTNAGVATFNWTAATSSTAAPAPSIAANSFAAMQVTLSTSTTYNETATSTYTVPWGHIWTAGTYMIFQTNATSSGATCTVGVHYLAS